MLWCHQDQVFTICRFLKIREEGPLRCGKATTIKKYSTVKSISNSVNKQRERKA